MTMLKGQTLLACYLLCWLSQAVSLLPYGKTLLGWAKEEPT